MARLEELAAQFGGTLDEPETPDYRAIAEQEARAAGLDPALVHKIIEAESAWNPSARSPKGAIGLMQLMPRTAQELGVDPNDPRQNIQGGVRYFKSLLDKYRDVPRALAAYNAGPQNVDHYGGIPPFPETLAYVTKIVGQPAEEIAPRGSGPTALEWLGKRFGGEIEGEPPDLERLAAQFGGELDEPEPTYQEPTPNSQTPTAPGKTLMQRQAEVGARIGDLGISALKGAIAVPEAAVGLADLVMTPVRMGVEKLTGTPQTTIAQDLEKVGFKPAEAKAILDTYYSDPQKAAFQKVQEANGVVDKAVAALSNPSVIAQTVVESAPLMVGGAGVARGLLKAAPRLSPIVAGAAGEGTVSAGSAAEQTRQQTGTLTPTQAGQAVGAGAGTALFGFVGGKLAQKLGIGDVDTLLAAAGRDPNARAGLVRAIIGGAFSEGFLEELPQSVQEQVWQNAATGKPLWENVDAAAVMGTLAGVVMGGGANAARSLVPAAPERPAEQPAADDAPSVEARIKELEQRVRARQRRRDMVKEIVDLALFRSKEKDPSPLATAFKEFAQKLVTPPGTQDADMQARWTEYQRSEFLKKVEELAQKPDLSVADVFRFMEQHPEAVPHVSSAQFTPSDEAKGGIGVTGEPLTSGSSTSIEEAKPEVESPASTPSASDTGASVPFMITKAQEAELRARGYDDTAIRVLSPAEAQEILAEPRRPATPSQTQVDQGQPDSTRIEPAQPVSPPVTEAPAPDNTQEAEPVHGTRSIPTPEGMEAGDEIEGPVAEWPDDQIRGELSAARAQLDQLQKSKHQSPEVIAQAEKNIQFWTDELASRGVAEEPTLAPGDEARIEAVKEGYTVRDGKLRTRVIADRVDAHVWDALHAVEAADERLQRARDLPEPQFQQFLKKELGQGGTYGRDVSWETRQGTITIGIGEGKQKLTVTQVSKIARRLINELLPKVDAAAPTAQTTPDVPPERRPGAATRPRRRAGRRGGATSTPRGEREDRRDTTDAGLFRRVHFDARRVDPAVDEVDLRDEFTFRIRTIRDLHGEAAESDNKGVALLRAVAKYGGLWWEARTGGFKGEVEGLLEARDIASVKAGTARIVHKKGRATWQGVAGVFHKDGLTPDGMVEALQEDGRFGYIETINDLLEALNRATRGLDKAPDVTIGTLLKDASIDPKTKWWEQRWRPLPEPDTAAVADEQKGPARIIPVPDGWTMVVGRTRTKEGHTFEAQVDWRDKRLVFAEQRHMDNPEIRNHEIGHVLVERVLSEADRDALLAEYVRLENVDEWEVKNHFHNEKIVIDLTPYLTYGKAPNDQLQQLFDRYIGPLVNPPEVVSLEDEAVSFNPEELEREPFVAKRHELTGDAADVQERAASALEADLQGFMDRYRERFGNVLNADNASELFEDYAKSPEARAKFFLAVRGPAGSLVEELYARMLAEPVEDGVTPVVLFTAGGNAAGKSSILTDAEKVHVVFDSTLSAMGPSFDKIQQALRADLDVWVRHISRDPEDAMRAAISRAQGDAQGRTVRVNGLITTHIRSQRVFLNLAEEQFAGNPRVQFAAFESLPNEAARPLTLDELRAREYPDPDVLKSRLRRIVDDEHRAGRISDALYEGTTGEPAPTHDAGAVREGERADVGERPQEVPTEGEVTDTLDTGESQPRLPEAGAVRDQNIETPEFDVPFSLTGESTESFRQGKQASIFDAPVEEEPVAPEPGESAEAHEPLPHPLSNPDALKTEEQLAAELGEITAPNVTLTDVPRELADRAHSGTSWTPERRGGMEQREYVHHMQKAWDGLQALAKTPEQQAAAATEFERYRTNWLAKNNELLASRGRLISVNVAGPSKFPVRRQQKAGDAYSKKLRDFLEWDKRAQKAMREAVAPSSSAVISSDRDDAVEALKAKIAEAEALQERMRVGNRVLREHKKAPREQQVQALIDAGFSEKVARKATVPDYAGRVGFPAFELRNNAANIKRMEARIRDIEETRARKVLSSTFDGGRVEENPENNRIQIFFDSKPNEQFRADLKRHGFRWAPSEGAWQRQRSENALYTVDRLLGTKLTRELRQGTGSEEPTGGGGTASISANVGGPLTKGQQQPRFPVTTAAIPGGSGQLPLVPPTPAATALTSREAKPIPFPELVELARDLLQTPGVVKAFRKVGKLGEFAGDKGIRLTADLFKRGNEQEVAEVLAHEIGHLVDWLPDHMLKRGNLLGRLFSLQKYLRHTFTSPNGRDIQFGPIRDELKALSAKWRPWDRSKASASFRAYRDSAVELYADALSVLFNNPGMLQAEAPLFYAAFFEGLDTKPDVKKAYFDLQDALDGTPEDIIARRHGRVMGMFKEGDIQAIDLERAKQAERLAARKNYWMMFRQQFVDKNVPLLDRIKAVEKAGGTIPQDEDPRYLLEERNYLGGKLKAFIERHIQPIHETLMSAGIDWHTFGAALFYERIMAGDRSELANPLGLQPKHAAEQRKQEIYDKLTGVQKALLNTQIDAFRRAMGEVAENAYEAGLYTDEMHDQMQANPAYATYRVLDHLDDGVSSRIFRQIGTLKEVQNVADATILKALVTIKATEHNKVKTAAFNFLHDHFPGDIEQAKEVWGGRGPRPVEPKKGDDRKMVTYMDRGRLRGKYVDGYIAQSLENESIGANNAFIAGLRLMNNNLFRPIFTSFNPGFQSFNLWRDFWRTWKNTPGMSVGRALYRYGQGHRLAQVRAFGLASDESGRLRQTIRTLTGKPATAPTAAERAAYQDLIDAEASGVLSITQNEFDRGRAIEDTQIEEIFAKHGLGGTGIAATPSHPALRPVKAVLGYIEKVGNYIETLPKAAVLQEFAAQQGGIDQLTPAQRSHVRRKIGSPDFLAGGTWKPVTNEIFLFSNAITQAWRADLEVATNPKTRAGWWWKTAALNIAPKVALFAALYGLGGDDGDEEDSELVKALRGITEYDLTNYLPIPIGVDDSGNAIYLRLPQDDTGRVIGGLFWKALGMARGDKPTIDSAMQILDYMAGQAPTVTPVVTAVKDTATVARGHNIRDDFRQRDVFTDDELAARDSRMATKFLAHQFQQLGGGIVYRFNINERPREKTAGQKVLELPIASNIVGRWIKVTNYGEVERLRNVQQKVAEGEARMRLDERSAVTDAITRLRGGQATPQAITTESRRIAQELYTDEPPQERLRQQRDIATKIRMGLARGAADPLTDAVLGAQSNDQKVQIVIRASKSMTDRELNQWMTRAMQQKVISPAVRGAVIRERRTQ